MCQMNPVQDIPLHFFQAHFSNTLPICIGFRRGLLVSGFPTKHSHAFFFSPKYNTCPAHHILIDLRSITIITSGVENLSGSSSLCMPHALPITFSLIYHDNNIRCGELIRKLLVMHATCPAHHIPLDFVTIIISGVENLSGSSSLCMPHALPITFPLILSP